MSHSIRFLRGRELAKSGEQGPGLQVIAIGLPRCATSSLQVAFESEWIGYKPCMHMSEVMPNTRRRQLVLEALNEHDTTKRQKLLAQLFADHNSSSDFPGSAFAIDLLDMYPDAKIILNLRNNGTEWETSYNESLAYSQKLYYYLVTLMYPINRDHYNISHAAWNFWSWQGDCTNPLENINGFGMPQFYDHHNARIRAEAEKRGIEILEWRAQDGWEPLCKFLGKPAPPSDVPFPRANDKRQMQMLQYAMVIRGLLTWAALGAAVYYGVMHGEGFLAKVQGFLGL
ncbi:hypothetical protein BX600DRAFT_459323 [Xylariales sp. PMI_506]|nr:hypothetical protein BX600DRAFT_459323 [Xylariales sp. PMI_506]